MIVVAYSDKSKQSEDINVSNQRLAQTWQRLMKL